MKYENISKIAIHIGMLAIVFFAMPLNAGMLSVWDSSWTRFSDLAEDKTGSFNYVNPGWGGQAFDAEYLFYKYDSHDNHLSIGLQTGFDVVNGDVLYGSRVYYSGDLALSLNGIQYAVDFGLYTEDYYNNDTVGGSSGTAGIDTAGIYSNVIWNNDIAFPISAPFAMETGTLISGALIENKSDSGINGETSYYRMVKIDLDLLTGISKLNEINAHWTMSCGNDAVNGHASVPEPSTLLLMATGLLGLVGTRKFKTKT